jgi:hypothetical protein
MQAARRPTKTFEIDPTLEHDPKESVPNYGYNFATKEEPATHRNPVKFRVLTDRLF